MGRILRADNFKDVQAQTLTTVLLPDTNYITVGGKQLKLTNAVLNLASSGIGGLDDALTANTFYNIFAAFSGANQGLIGALTEPTSVDAFVFIGTMFTDGASQVLSAGGKDAENKSPIGAVIFSRLTEAQFQAQHGPGWILMDGRSIAGSKLEAIAGISTIEDARGLAIRGKNNGRADGNENPDGDLALGAFQNHGFSQHDHGGGAHEHSTIAQSTTVNGNTLGTFPIWNLDGAPQEGTRSYGLPDTTVIALEGGNENRMRNITLNPFIKIN